MSTATIYTPEQMLELLRESSGDDEQWVRLAAEKFNAILLRGDKIAVYQNVDLGHPELGHRQYLSYGSPEAALETAEPPERLPDWPGKINWRYCLQGVLASGPVRADEDSLPVLGKLVWFCGMPDGRLALYQLEGTRWGPMRYIVDSTADSREVAERQARERNEAEGTDRYYAGYGMGQWMVYSDGGRLAVIERRNERPTGEEVAAYLPRHYHVQTVTPERIVIGGRDNAGWTLDDYVIPRLASGMIFAREVK